ncbi:hypothetical protein [Nostoc sp. 'Peltigera malacea cyanobiont' DB3992]|uniref:hypothetical protein n=1 Tax=Nostoc sp. 'Peltigera malacea cyanobiont' DB3992 TaxID=1206980 RepID=UPI0015D50758|nr:hypothetical protein [Nostoc sp. 'Peltigera malacea cyanobiont' DB3992]
MNYLNNSLVKARVGIGAKTKTVGAGVFKDPKSLVARVFLGLTGYFGLLEPTVLGEIFL